MSQILKHHVPVNPALERRRRSHPRRRKTSCFWVNVFQLTLHFTPIFLFPVPLCACMRLTTRLLSMTGEVAATLTVGNRLRGKEGSYKVLEQFTKDRDVWKAM